MIDNTSDNGKLTEDLVKMIIEMRENAKANKNYEVSDQLRNQLVNLGVTLKDGKNGTTFVIN